MKVNSTDKVHTLDIDGNIVHIFQGFDWNAFSVSDIETLKTEGAFRAKVINRKGELRSITFL